MADEEKKIKKVKKEKKDGDDEKVKKVKKDADGNIIKKVKKVRIIDPPVQTVATAQLLKSSHSISQICPNYDPAIPEGGIRIGHYILSKTLGTGTFGKVKLAVHQVTRHKVAVKILNRRKIKTLDVVSKIRREIQNLKLVRHPHIIKLYQVISSPTEFYMVMEYVAGGELFDYIVQEGKLQEEEARKMFQQIISGVDYCHRHNVVHRDLKPENLLLDTNLNVRIADFGLSNMMADGEFLRTSCGSPNYAAPEVISGKLYAGPEIDVWSCGVILYALVCGILPFDDEHVPHLFRKIRAGIFSIPEHVSKEVAYLIRRMLEVDQVKRITIKEIKQETWFKEELPDYLFPDELLKDHRSRGKEIIDMETVQEVAKQFGTSDALVVRAIEQQQAKNQSDLKKLEESQGSLITNDPDDQSLAGTHNNPLFAAYCMIVDVKIAYDQAPDFYHAAEMSDYSNPSNLKLIQRKGGQMMPHPEKIMFFDVNVMDPMPEDHGSYNQGNTGGRKTKPSKWHLGIRSNSTSYDIMYEVYKAMRKLGFKWQTITPFYLVVRRKVVSTRVGEVDRYSYLTLQLYQIDEKNYLLDFANKTDKQEGSRENSSTDLQYLEGLEKYGEQGKVICRDGERRMPNQHIIMEFFEMCSVLIKSLAGGG